MIRRIVRSPLARKKKVISPSSLSNAGPLAESFRRDRRHEKKEAGITRISIDEFWSLPPGDTDWEAVDRLTDEDIARAVAEDPDAAPIDLDWSRAKVYGPLIKRPTSLRIDPDVLAFFKSFGKGYQTRMNAVLRSYMEHELTKKQAK